MIPGWDCFCNLGVADRRWRGFDWFLQRVSIASYAKRCISYDRFCPMDGKVTVCNENISVPWADRCIQTDKERRNSNRAFCSFWSDAIYHALDEGNDGNRSSRWRLTAVERFGGIPSVWSTDKHCWQKGSGTAFIVSIRRIGRSGTVLRPCSSGGKGQDCSRIVKGARWSQCSRKCYKDQFSG